jgi:hypothetical protein
MALLINKLGQLARPSAGASPPYERMLRGLASSPKIL